MANISHLGDYKVQIRWPAGGGVGRSGHFCRFFFICLSHEKMRGEWGFKLGRRGREGSSGVKSLLLANQTRQQGGPGRVRRRGAPIVTERVLINPQCEERGRLGGSAGRWADASIVGS